MVKMDEDTVIELSKLLKASIESSATSTFSQDELLTLIEMIQSGGSHKSLASKALIALPQFI